MPRKASIKIQNKEEIYKRSSNLDPKSIQWCVDMDITDPVNDRSDRGD